MTQNDESSKLFLYFRLFSMIFLQNIWFWGVWTWILSVWICILGFGLIFFGFWTYNFGFWTYILGFELIFWVSGPIFWVLDSYFGCLDLYFGCPGGRAGGRPGRVSSTFRGKSILGICILKKWILYISSNADFGIFLQKRRAPKNAAFWSDKCSEISHMRPIQARKLKLIQVLIFESWVSS